MIDLALYQPDIPQNVGAAIRLCACLGLRLHVVEPCGFPWDERKIRAAAMDYIEKLNVVRHSGWDAFKSGNAGRRIVLLTTKTETSYYDFTFHPGDILLTGRESAGVPDDIHSAANARITIPMAPGMRSLNVINAAAMVAGEAVRQVKTTCSPAPNNATATS